MATRPSKKQKTLLTIESSDEEEEEQETKQAKKVTPPKQATRKAQKPWNPKIEKIDIAIANEENLFK